MIVFPFHTLGRLPHPGDNVAIALRRLEVGTVVQLESGRERALQHTILEGHRFAVCDIPRGAPLLSWSQPFGYATVDIAAGDYVCNAQTVDVLSKRDLGGATLPSAGNFENRVLPYAFDPAALQPVDQVPLAPDAASQTFPGFPRGGGRGTGTRNFLVVLGTSSRTAAFARALTSKADHREGGLDGIVAIAHTEGGGAREPHNQAEILRTLAGFMVNPNVGAVLAIDEGDEPINNARLEAYAREHHYPLADVPHRFVSVGSSSPAAEVAAKLTAQIEVWASQLVATRRVAAPLSELRIGLQCGGSDAFSGVSANPLVGTVGREVIRHGGAVNLAETDELVGAESYVLAKVKDGAVARRLLELIAGFKERLSWHGVTVEGNPSGGNRFRGLYNINLKSLGAAMKKDPSVRLDHAIDYAVPMRAPGFYFMNSPGNDLESVAGQAGAGCNLIFFTTGNGSVTNFPFVPTIKITSTTRRHRLLEHEMDVNAGAYLDGTPMEQLTQEMFALVRRVAGGERTKGELAGHSQVSLWREWRQTDPSHLAALRARPRPSGRPVAVGAPTRGIFAGASPADLPAVGAPAADVALVIPTSMCSSQIARMAAERMSTAPGRYVALPHTEGCGFAGDALYATLPRTYRGYATHPSVTRALFLEHGCEKIPNDVVKNELRSAGLDPANFGWASVQLDGGIEAVIAKIERWFATTASSPTRQVTDSNDTTLSSAPSDSALQRHRATDEIASVQSASPVGAAPVAVKGSRRTPNVALLSQGKISEATAESFGAVAHFLLRSGGSVLIASSDQLLSSPAFRAAAGLPLSAGPNAAAATLSYGEAVRLAGFHIVDTESNFWTENLTGLGACGAELMLAVINGPARPGHPFIPVLQWSESADGPWDGVLRGSPPEDVRALLGSLAKAASGAPTKTTLKDFQLTRGELGVST